MKKLIAILFVGSLLVGGACHQTDTDASPRTYPRTM